MTDPAYLDAAALQALHPGMTRRGALAWMQANDHHGRPRGFKRAGRWFIARADLQRFEDEDRRAAWKPPVRLTATAA